MKNTVLFVDPSPEWQRSLSRSGSPEIEGFNPVVVRGGYAAIKLLGSQDVGVVVCQHRMPDMETAQWFDHLRHLYPDIAVILVSRGIESPDRKDPTIPETTCFFDPSKPFAALLQTIKKIIDGETEGGSLQSISLETFVQLIEMEQKTCTIRVINEAEVKKGVLFFKNGQLIDARLGNLRGKTAAYTIFSWEKVALCIQNACGASDNRINEHMEAFLLEALAQKDEASAERNLAPPTAVQRPATTVGHQAPTLIETLHRRLKIANPGIVEDIYHDPAWDPLVEQARRIGALIDAGPLKACYLDDGSSFSRVLIPGTHTAVVKMKPGASRDPILKTIIA